MTKILLVSFSITLSLVAQIPLADKAFQLGEWLRVADSGMNNFPIDGQSGPILGRPMTANEVRHAEQILSDGSHINSSETERFYRDSSGRMRTETATGAIIFDPVAGFTYDLTASRKTYTKRPVSPNTTITIAAAAHRSSISSHDGQSKPKPGTATQELPTQLLNGVYVKGVRMTITIPAGAIGNDHDLKVINERWYSDDLESLVKTFNSDPRFGTHTYELTNISQGSPDPSLFQLPAGYTEGH